MDELLAEKLKSTGEYPQKIAFSLNARRSMADFGLNEAQILYLIGVRPVWDTSNRVRDVELVPAEELGRPRIDAFIETYHYYSEYLESRARLLDRAIRMVSELDEPDNYLFQNAKRVREELVAAGVSADEANILSLARIFSLAPGKFGSGAHDALFGSTGLWTVARNWSTFTWRSAITSTRRLRGRGIRAVATASRVWNAGARVEVRRAANRADWRRAGALRAPSPCLPGPQGLVRLHGKGPG
ncbi:MAG: cobaltochelatase subunit CobN [Planctomycetes bacterium]|nr:cobaltochelatase subunit CobN [Planctomycetota bacterium]